MRRDEYCRYALPIQNALLFQQMVWSEWETRNNVTWWESAESPSRAFVGSRSSPDPHAHYMLHSGWATGKTVWKVTQYILYPAEVKHTLTNHSLFMSKGGNPLSWKWGLRVLYLFIELWKDRAPKHETYEHKPNVSKYKITVTAEEALSKLMFWWTDSMET